jgi:hypothetical protein
MQEMSRLLARLERPSHLLFWSTCNLRPDNVRAPKTVALNATVRALVLTPEASRFLVGGTGTEEGNE